MAEDKTGWLYSEGEALLLALYLVGIAPKYKWKTVTCAVCGEPTHYFASSTECGSKNVMTFAEANAFKQHEEDNP